MAGIDFHDVSKVYPDGTHAVRGLNLEIADGEFLVFVGPSGCGKTTALRMVAGLEEITSGTISIGGRPINDVPPKDRDIAMVFQNYALYPHMTVEENLSFGLRRRKVNKREIEQRVASAAANLGLEDYLHRKPRALSGGQRQRVAMGRAIVREPQAFLMDEPLSNLDAKLRVQMRAEIQSLQRRLGVTTIYVTHDQTEAMTMGDRIAVMNGGTLQQVGRPETVYHRPHNTFVAAFIGSPAMNMIPATLSQTPAGLLARFGRYELALDGEVLRERPALQQYAGERVLLGVRPEDMEVSAFVSNPEPATSIEVRCGLREALGAELLVHFEVEFEPERRSAPETLLDSAPRFVARVNAGARAEEGELVQLTVNTRRLHFFDLQTGDAIYQSQGVGEMALAPPLPVHAL